MSLKTDLDREQRLQTQNGEEWKPSNESDQLLIEQAQAGYLEAFGLLAQKYQRKVYEIAYSFTRHVDEAEDLSQEIFLKAYSGLSQFRSSSTFYTWLYRIAHNAGIDYVRSQRSRSEYVFFDDFPCDDSLLHPRLSDNQIYSQAEASEIMDRINQAVAKLSFRQQQVFALRYYQHLPLSRIAEMLKIRIGSVKAHLFKAIRNLQQSLASYMHIHLNT